MRRHTSGPTTRSDVAMWPMIAMSARMSKNADSRSKIA
jgi:hypothetical protein